MKLRIVVCMAHIVLLVFVALHEGDDAVVNEEGQSEDTCQLREELSELWKNNIRQIIPQ